MSTQEERQQRLREVEALLDEIDAQPSGQMKHGYRVDNKIYDLLIRIRDELTELVK